MSWLNIIRKLGPSDLMGFNLKVGSAASTSSLITKTGGGRKLVFVSNVSLKALMVFQ